MIDDGRQVSVDQVSADVGAGCFLLDVKKSYWCLSIRSVLTSAPQWPQITYPGPVVSVDQVSADVGAFGPGRLVAGLAVSVDQVSADVGALFFAPRLPNYRVSVDQVSADVGAVDGGLG